MRHRHPTLRLEGFTRLGRIDLSQGAVVTVREWGSRHAGEIEVRGGQLTLSGGSQLDASTQGAGRGGTVTVQATEALTLTGLNSRLTSSTSGDGDAGRIVVQAPRVSLQEGTDIQARATLNSRGNAGAIRMEVGTLTLTGENSTTAPTISASTAWRGAGGSITVQATEAITLAGPSSRITSNSDLEGDGDAGQIVVKAPVVDLRGAAAGIRASAFKPNGPGNAGTILLEVDTLTLSGGATISSTNAGTGQAGSITVRATGAITLAGVNSRLNSLTVGRGKAGDILVEAGTLTLTGGASITTSTDPVRTVRSGAGPGGASRCGPPRRPERHAHGLETAG